MKKRNRILVTAIGSFSALAAIDSLKKHNFYVVGCDYNQKELIACSVLVDKYYKCPKAVEQKKYINFIYDLCKKESLSFILPLTDIEVDVFNKNRQLFENSNILLCMSPVNTINICRDKYQTYSFLKKNKINNLIKTELLSNVDISNVKYPVIVKPLDGRSSNGMRCIDKSKELKDLLKTINKDKYIAQKRIKGNIITVDICRDAKNNKTVCLARKELIRTHNGAGLSVKIINDKSIIDYCVKIADILDICGTVNFELIITDRGSFYFLECNPRLSGGVGFSTKAGYDFVYNGLKCFCNKTIDSINDVKEMYIVKQYHEVVTK